jgi:photoactive yellow protein
MDEKTTKIIEELVKLEGEPEQVRVYIDSLPTGVIQLDLAGRIVQYNQAESQKTGRKPANVIGRSFFEVAPCLRVQEFHQRFLDAVATKSLDVEFNATFDLPGSPNVKIFMFYGKQTNTIWCLVEWL